MPGCYGVKLELLRHGPPHNQLLSPLTEYLALSGDHEPCTVRVPWEHTHLLDRLRVLRYEETALAARQVRLAEVAAEMGRLLGAVPGLAADLRGGGGDDTLTHLRLVFSASELALLPFELAAAPGGFPGEGRPLALQLDAPLALTRETRAAAGRATAWPTRPRVLFAVAAPLGGIEPGLVLAHLQALRQAVAPYRLRTGVSLADTFGAVITVLEQASYRAIEAACAQDAYTHVHILAHGITFESEGELRYGLALHPDRAGQAVDRVDGMRLARALRVHRSAPAGQSHPTLVTLASCDSGQQGSVLVPGASLAHTLHEAGIPLVVASQFPLSKRASVVLTRTLYGRLLRGDDPRRVLHDVRQRLHGFDASTHDWASLVVYAALPEDLDDQLRQVATDQAVEAMRVALFDVWRAETTETADAGTPEPAATAPAATRRGFRNEQELAQALGRLDAAIESAADWADEELDRGLRETQQRHTDVVATIAATRKRKAEYLWLQAYWLRQETARDVHERGRRDELQERAMLERDTRAAELLEAMEAALRAAYAGYRRAFVLNPASHWAATSTFALKRIIEKAVDTDLWEAARRAVAFARERRKIDPLDCAWGQSADVELVFHAAFTRELRGRLGRADPADLCEKLIKDLIREQGQESEITRATRYQMRRYIEWWPLSRDHVELARQIYYWLGGVPARTTADSRQHETSGPPAG